MKREHAHYDKKFYVQYLNQALNALFRSYKDNGFWDEKEGKIIEALNYHLDEKGGISWSVDNSIGWRYAPFALMGVMLWRISGEISSNIYDTKIKSNLNYFIKKIRNKERLSHIPSYGMGSLILSFSLAFRTFNEEIYKKTAFDLYRSSLERFDFNNSEDSLLLYGWCFLYEVDKNNSDIKNNIEKSLKGIIKKQDNNGLFIFKNPTTKRHQNQMYTLWGVSKAIEVLNKKEYLTNVEKTIDYTINHRMLDDGALLWEDNIPLIYRLGGLPGLKERYWEYLYECHQTFFINAVFQYYNARGRKNYDKFIKKAVQWIFDENSLNKNLVEMSGIGVPMRMMTKNAKLDVKGQMFKGTYEIGSYIMALMSFALSHR